MLDETTYKKTQLGLEEYNRIMLKTAETCLRVEKLLTNLPLKNTPEWYQLIAMGTLLHENEEIVKKQKLKISYL